MALWRATVNLAYATGSTAGTNTWHLRSTGVEPADTDIQDLMDAIQSYYDDFLAAFCPTSYHATFDGSVQEVGSVDPNIIGGFTTWDEVGGAGTSYGPNLAQVCVGWRTAQGSRRGRGRTFMGPLSSAVFGADGTIDNTALLGMQGLAHDLVAASEGFSNGAIGVYSSVDHVLRDFTGFVINDRVAYLSSRRG